MTIQIKAYQFAQMPKVIFGEGVRRELPALVSSYGGNVLVLTGGQSFKTSNHHLELMQGLEAMNCMIQLEDVMGEPSVQRIDAIVAKSKTSGQLPDVVVAIGGGSVLDAGKAVSAMLMETESVKAFLEIVGTRKPTGKKVPFIAVPTTSGTGSEATKNAVISDVGRLGFKCSLRHEKYVPDLTLIDPELMLTLPMEVTAACGLDALTQLLEAYVSTQASPITDALAWSGLEYFKMGFDRVLESGNHDVEARAAMAQAAFLSGVVLANAGLGVVHGFASQLGAYYPAPHGVVCAALLPDCTKANLKALWSTFENKADEKTVVAIEKYAAVGRLLGTCQSPDHRAACTALETYLEKMVSKSQVRKLSHYGLCLEDFEKIVAGTDVKNGPAQLSDAQLTEILHKQL